MADQERKQRECRRKELERAMQRRKSTPFASRPPQDGSNDEPQTEAEARPPGKRKKKEKIRSRDITGLKYFDQLSPLLERLHEVGCQRDTAGNRKLHLDQYCMLVLLFLFNPVVSSLRALQQASELKKVQRKLGCSRASLGSLSEATDVFEPERLAEIVEELSLQLQPVGVISDAVGRLGSPKSRRIEHPDHLVRLVTIRAEPHPKRGGRRREAAS